jgi:hypothetical protein
VRDEFGDGPHGHPAGDVGYRCCAARTTAPGISGRPPLPHSGSPETWATTSAELTGLLCTGHHGLSAAFPQVAFVIASRSIKRAGPRMPDGWERSSRSGSRGCARSRRNRSGGGRDGQERDACGCSPACRLVGIRVRVPTSRCAIRGRCRVPPTTAWGRSSAHRSATPRSAGAVRWTDRGCPCGRSAGPRSPAGRR